MGYQVVVILKSIIFLYFYNILSHLFITLAIQMLRYPVSGIPSKVVPVFCFPFWSVSGADTLREARMYTRCLIESRFGSLKAGTAFPNSMMQ